MEIVFLLFPKPSRPSQIDFSTDSSSSKKILDDNSLAQTSVHFRRDSHQISLFLSSKQPPTDLSTFVSKSTDSELNLHLNFSGHESDASLEGDTQVLPTPVSSERHVSADKSESDVECLSGAGDEFESASTSSATTGHFELGTESDKFHVQDASNSLLEESEDDSLAPGTERPSVDHPHSHVLHPSPADLSSTECQVMDGPVESHLVSGDGDKKGHVAAPE